MNLKNLVNELKYIGILFVIGVIGFKICFYKESFVVVIRTVFSLFWLFVLPGFSLMYYWHDKLSFLERLIIGVALGAALIGSISYYLGLLGLHIKYHGIILPVLFLIVAFIIIVKKKE